MFRKISQLVLIIIFATTLVACSAPIASYDNGIINITPTIGWNIMSPNKSNAPIVVMNYTDKAQITITKKTFNENIDSQTFINQNIAQAEKLPNYQNISIKKTQISNQKTTINTFKAQVDQNTTNTFIQTYFVQNKNTYIITAIASENADKTIQREILKVINKIKFNKEETTNP